MNVRKRSGKVVPFDAGFIHRAISLASAAAGEQDEAAIDAMTQAVTDKLSKMGKAIIDIEKIQDTVEDTLFEQMHYQTAKAYILYRMEKEKERTSGTWQEGLLSREFLSPYKHAPNPMGQLGAFVYTRTYSRFLPKLGRREYWWETVRRAARYSRGVTASGITSIICASSCPAVPSGWAARRWPSSTPWPTTTAPSR